MPADEVMHLYRQHKLHSGPGGPIVKSKKQATAIQISMARKEGHHIPEVKGSFQEGGTVPETGNYEAHAGEELVPDRYAGATHQNFSFPIRDTSVGEPPDIGSAPAEMPPMLGSEKGPAKPAQKGRHIGSDDNPQLRAMAENVAAPLQRVQGFKRGGTIPRTGIYRLHEGERVIPKSLASRYREMKR
jgi:hypothetical protein